MGPNWLSRIFPDRRDINSLQRSQRSIGRGIFRNQIERPILTTKRRGSRVDGSLDYKVKIDRNGNRLLPRDMYSIVVVATSYPVTNKGGVFTSPSSVIIAEDTTVRERWFGYCGKHLSSAASIQAD